MSTDEQAQEHVRLRGDGLAWREVDGEIIVLDNVTSQYMSINGSGTRLWAELAEGSSVSRLADRLVEVYQLDPAQARADVAAFLDLLAQHRLLAR